ncbi:MAG: 50S ribosomal protein L18 [Legionellales bacterium RIFCSPHIGHO2_12_FULL_37_14]|nr:MAG: 50S ribosomal protein L18 [Legionellales bacterium RIFCSPHIGHO2_12_FULL_37_14]
MKTKLEARKRRGLKAKALIRKSPLRARLVVHRTGSHIYAQIVKLGEKGDVVLASASTLEKDVRNKLKGTKVEHAQHIGKLLGERAKKKDIIDVAFDRAGYKYHGRVKALATGAREAGLNF